MIDTWLAQLPHDITLSCRSTGERGRPVLVFLHGFPEAAFVWDDLLEHFARPENGGYRCVAPNLRGYERSSSPHEVEAYQARLLTQDIVALIQQEVGPGGQLAALLAHDWGGAVAWNVASVHPELMKRLVIINSPHPQPFIRELTRSPAHQAASAYMNFLARPDSEGLLADNDFARLWPFFDLSGAAGPEATERALALLPPAQQAHHRMAQPPEGAGWMTEAVRQKYRTIWQGDGSRPGAGLTGQLNYYRVTPMHPPREGDPGAAAVKLPPDAFTVRVPTLVLWAMNDPALLPTLLDGLETWVPDLQIERLDGATHWVVHERPQWTAERIGAFLAT